MSSNKLKLLYYIRSKKEKYTKSFHLEEVLEFYKTEYEKLF